MPQINHKLILHTTFHPHTKSSVLFSAEEVLTLNSVPFKTKRKNFLYSNEETVYLVLITYQKQFFKSQDWWHIIKCSSPILTLRHLVSCWFIQVYFLSVFYSLKMVTKNSHAKNVVSLVIRALFFYVIAAMIFYSAMMMKMMMMMTMSWIADQQKCVGIISSRFITAGSHDRISQHTADLNLCKTKVLTCLTYFSPKSHFVKKPVISFILQIKWLVSVSNATLGWNGSKRVEKKR